MVEPMSLEKIHRLNRFKSAKDLLKEDWYIGECCGREERSDQPLVFIIFFSIIFDGKHQTAGRTYDTRATSPACARFRELVYILTKRRPPCGETTSFNELYGRHAKVKLVHGYSRMFGCFNKITDIEETETTGKVLT